MYCKICGLILQTTLPRKPSPQNPTNLIVSPSVIWSFKKCQHEKLLSRNTEIRVKAEKRMLLLTLMVYMATLGFSAQHLTLERARWRGLGVLGHALGYSNSLLGVVSGDRLIDVTTGPHSALFYASPKSEFRPARFMHIDPQAFFA